MTTGDRVKLYCGNAKGKVIRVEEDFDGTEIFVVKLHSGEIYRAIEGEIVKD